MSPFAPRNGVFLSAARSRFLTGHRHAAVSEPMSDDLDPSSDDVPADTGPALAMPEPREDVAPDVTLVVPAEAYTSIATDRPDAASAVPAAAADTMATVLAAVGALSASLERRFDGLQAQF